MPHNWNDVKAKGDRNGLLAIQLIEDLDRYKAHPDCKLLLCFVYDPEGHIPNPRGIEGGLSRDKEPFPVKVLMRPRTESITSLYQRIAKSRTR